MAKIEDIHTIFLFDANSLIHRAFHALPPLTAPDGRPVQAVYGVASILLKLWKEGRPQYAAALFDRPEPTFRKERYDAYKAQRAKAPDELVSQIIETHRLFEMLGIPVFELPGWEADDLIATLARTLTKKNKNVRVIIFTGDLDTLQLVEDGRIAVRALKTGVSETMLYDEAAVKARYGLSPKQLPDYKAFVGDPSDNIKGVPGIGPKTASSLVLQFGSLEKIYDAAEKDEKLGKKLLPFRVDADLAKELVVLHDNAPLGDIPLDTLKAREDFEGARNYFENLGFRALLKRMNGGVLSRSEVISSETSLSHRTVVNFPEYCVLKDTLPVEILESKKVKIGFNLKQKLKNLWESGKDCSPPYFDCGVAAWLLDPDAKTYDQNTVIHRAFKTTWNENEEEYRKIFEREYRMLFEYGLLDIFETIEMPLLRVLGEMEKRGIRVQKIRLQDLLHNTDKRIETLEQEIYQYAGERFNLNSPREVGRILFEKLEIGGKESRTPTGQRTTREDVLHAIADRHPIIEKILSYREFFKVQSTYIIPLLECSVADERVHTEFVQTGTGTGRLSSRNPNIQNIPQNFIWANELRSAFVAQEGWSLVACDYTQIELRILAAVTGDEGLIGACRRGDDLHKITASRVLGIAPEKVSDKDRRLAKTLNFGLVYGMGSRAFAEAAGISSEEAKRFIAQYFSTFSRVKEWQEGIKTYARTEGYVQTLSGRRRYLPDILSSFPRARADAERLAINHPIQGLGADIMKCAMVGVWRMITDKKWEDRVHMLLSIHDELLFEVRDDMIEIALPRISECMESAYALAVPLTVKIAIGKDWGNLTVWGK
ncbi:MAG: DNA polymerase [Patescibacteria group bacterium]|nr:DNA polymerase [Patescibacteria group bacterium]